MINESPIDIVSKTDFNLQILILILVIGVMYDRVIGDR